MIGDFSYSDLTTFEIKPQSTEVLKETFIPSSNSSAISMNVMFIALTNKNCIYFSIKPATEWSRVIYTSEYSNIGQYKADDLSPGQYGFIFYNKDEKESIHVMFGLHIENAKDTLANVTKNVVEQLGDEVNPLHKRLLELQRLVATYATHQQMISTHSDMQYLCNMLS